MAAIGRVSPSSLHRWRSPDSARGVRARSRAEGHTRARGARRGPEPPPLPTRPASAPALLLHLVFPVLRRPPRERKNWDGRPNSDVAIAPEDRGPLSAAARPGAPAPSRLCVSLLERTRRLASSPHHPRGGARGPGPRSAPRRVHVVLLDRPRDRGRYGLLPKLVLNFRGGAFRGNGQTGRVYETSATVRFRATHPLWMSVFAEATGNDPDSNLSRVLRVSSDQMATKAEGTASAEAPGQQGTRQLQGTEKGWCGRRAEGFEGFYEASQTGLRQQTDGILPRL